MSEKKEGIIDEMKELSQILFGNCVWCNNKEIGDNLITCNECSKLHSLKESKEKATRELKRLNKDEENAKEIMMKELGIEKNEECEKCGKEVKKLTNFGATMYDDNEYNLCEECGEELRDERISHHIEEQNKIIEEGLKNGRFNLIVDNYMNTKNIVIENALKPCYVLCYCPYGALVEYYPLEEEPKYSCKLFGHNCPVFYLGEPLTEFDKMPSNKEIDNKMNKMFKEFQEKLK